MMYSKLALGLCSVALLFPGSTLGFTLAPRLGQRSVAGRPARSLVSFADPENTAAEDAVRDIMDTAADAASEVPEGVEDAVNSVVEAASDMVDAAPLPVVDADAEEEGVPASTGSFDPTQKLPLAQMEEGAIYPGIVKRIMDYGAFVNIGSERDVLVHISEFSTNYVYDVHDYVEEGQELSLRLISVDLDARRMQGSFILDDALRSTKGRRKPERKQREPKDVSPFADIGPDEVLEGTVVKCVAKGAFVQVPTVSTSADGWLSNSEIDSDDYVEYSADYLTEGQDVRVRVINCDVDEGRLAFSQKGC